MKYIFNILLVVFAFLSSVQAKDYRAGDFDYYILAVSWQSAFCEKHQKKPECQLQTVNDVSAKNFSLHGLWPNQTGDKRHQYGYCSVDKQTRQLDKSRRWCSLGAAYSDKELITKMPGTLSCLQMHEWIKHGSCTEMPIEKYYALSLDLLDSFNQTKLAKVVRENIGTEVSKESLLSAWEQEFPEGKKSLRLVCKKMAGRSYLTEVRVALKKNAANKLGANLLPKTLGKSRCDSKIYIDRAGF